MSKHVRKNPSSLSYAKKVGRSRGELVYSPELNRLTSKKIFDAIKSNKS